MSRRKLVILGIAVLVLLSSGILVYLRQPKSLADLIGLSGPQTKEWTQFQSPEFTFTDTQVTTGPPDQLKLAFEGGGGYGQVAKWGSRGNGKGQFNSPNDLAIDKDGYVYVADWGNFRIQKFDNNGNPWQWLGKGSDNSHGWHQPDSLVTPQIGQGQGEFTSGPTRVAVDGNKNIFTVDKWSRRVQKFKTDGTFLAQWEGVDGCQEKQFQQISDIAVTVAGNILITDTSCSRILKFDNNGTYLSKWSLPSPYVYGDMSDLAVDVKGSIYLVMKRLIVEKYDQNGLSQGRILELNSNETNIEGITVDKDSNVYVTVAYQVPGSTFDHKVLKIDSQGQKTIIIDIKPQDNSQWTITGVAIDAAGNVFVIDQKDNAVIKYAPSGQTYQTYKTPGTALLASFDSGAKNTAWKKIYWQAQLPAGTSVQAEICAANETPNVSQCSWVNVGSSGADIQPSLLGQFAAIKLTLAANTDKTQTPVVSNLKVEYTKNAPPHTPSAQPCNYGPFETPPKLAASAFLDDDNDGHKASQWRVRPDGKTYDDPATKVYPTSSPNLTSFQLPPDFSAGKYFWQVRYQDDKENWSEWSNECSFEIVVSLPTVSLELIKNEVNESEPSVNVKVKISQILDKPVMGNLSYAGSTATPGTDFRATGSFYLPPNQAETLVNIPIIDDSEVEPKEMVKIAITDITSKNAKSGGSGVEFYIIDNDQTVKFELSASQVKETEGSANIKLLVAPEVKDPITIGFTVAGTAERNKDYQLDKDSVTIYGSSATIPITILDDKIVEKDETVEFTINPPPAGARYSPIEPSKHTLTIIDDDKPPVSLSLSAFPKIINEHKGFNNLPNQTTITASIPTGYVVETDIAVNLSFSGSANRKDPAGKGDYTMAEKIVIPIGQLSGSADLIALDDWQKETAEIADVVIRSVDAGVIGRPSGVRITINDDNDHSIIFSPNPATDGTTEPASNIDQTNIFGVEDGQDLSFTINPKLGLYIRHINILDLATGKREAVTQPLDVSADYSFKIEFKNVKTDYKVETTFIPKGTKSWDGHGQDDRWDNSLDWSGNTVPKSSDSVYFGYKDGAQKNCVAGGADRAVMSFVMTDSYQKTVSFADNNLAVSNKFFQSGRSQGTFLAPPQGKNLTIYKEFITDGGIFNANGGTVIFMANNNVVIQPKRTVFADVVFNKVTGNATIIFLNSDFKATNLDVQNESPTSYTVGGNQKMWLANIKFSPPKNNGGVNFGDSTLSVYLTDNWLNANPQLSITANVTLESKNTSTISGHNVFERNFTCEVRGKEIQFETNKLQTFKGKLFLKGSAKEHLILSSTASWLIDASVGNIVTNVKVSNSYNMGEKEITDYTDNPNANGKGNYRWIFKSPSLAQRAAATVSAAATTVVNTASAAASAIKSAVINIVR